MKVRKHRNKSSIRASNDRPTLKKAVKKTKAEVEPFKNIPCDSSAERYTLYYLFELQEQGLITNIRRAESFLLFNAVTRSWIEKLKTKCRTNTEVIHMGCSYTPDFAFDLTHKGYNCSLFRDINGQGRLFERGKYFFVHQKGVVHIETKGTRFRGENDTTEKFSVTKKWLWEKHGIFVCLFCHDRVFPQTFTPKEYQLTDKSRQQRKINWRVKSLHEYLNTLK